MTVARADFDLQAILKVSRNDAGESLSIKAQPIG